VRRPFLTAVILLLTANLALAWLSRAEQPRPRPPLADLPLGVAERWSGRDVALDARAHAILKVSDYVLRAYVPPVDGGAPAKERLAPPDEQQVAPVYLYVGYYDTQRNGATYHSPKNCLPGSGWQLTESGEEDLSLPVSGRITVNRVVIEKELDRQLVLYWYQDRGRSVASEYSAKFYLVWDAMTRNRTDGALVRVSTPILGTPEDAHAHALAFLADAWPLLVARLPS